MDFAPLLPPLLWYLNPLSVGVNHSQNVFQFHHQSLKLESPRSDQSTQLVSTHSGAIMTSAFPYMTNSSPSKRSNTDQKKLRSACDSCHQCKVKCSGGSPCFRCTSKGLTCRYGYQNRAGKPKGSKNRRTLEREHQMRMERLSSQLQDTSREVGSINMDLLDPSILFSGSWEPVSSL